jgi:hypothetical protein
MFDISKKEGKLICEVSVAVLLKLWSFVRVTMLPRKPETLGARRDTTGRWFFGPI